MRHMRLALSAVLIMLSCAAWAEQPAKLAALEGYDPVLLTEGKEVAGKESITAAHQQFSYQFSSEETRERFKKDPARYSIQLDGACARMGAPVGGRPESYAVHEGRIYIFGSSDCYKAFVAAPSKYLESAQPRSEWNPSSADKERGASMLAKVIAATGGESRWKTVLSYVEIRDGGPGRADTEITRAVKAPDIFSVHSRFPKYEFGTLLRGSDAVAISRGEGRRIPANFAKATEQNFFDHELLTILTCRDSDQFAATSTANELLVNHKGTLTSLHLHPATGRIESVAYQARGQGGAFGKIVTTLSDYRNVDGFMLPFHAESTFNGEPAPDRTWTVQKYVLNPADIEARIQMPSKISEF